ncbi:MAG: DUF4390 domain-containing protein [Acidobacteriota bacterium]
MKALPILGMMLLAPVLASSADVRNLQIAMEEDGVHVSFGLVDAFHEEIMARIRSGLETTFEVKIRVDEELELWFNRRVCERELRLSCTHDTPGSVYRVTKSLDGNVFESLVLDNEEDMKRAMTVVDRLKVLDAGVLRRNADYQLKVKAELLSRYVLLVIPWDIDTPWRKKKFIFN